MTLKQWFEKAAGYFQRQEFEGEGSVSRKLEELQRIGGDPETQERTAAYLLDRDRHVRHKAVSMLAGQERRRLNPAQQNVFLVSTGDWEGLRRLEAKELIEAWEQEDSLSPGGFWTLYLLASLERLGGQAEEPLAEMAEDSSRRMNTRIAALWALGLRGAQDRLPTMRSVLTRDRNQRMRLAAVQACRFLGGSALDCLTDLLAWPDPDPEVLAASARSLGWHGGASVERLRPLLDSRERLVREQAALALLYTATAEGLAAVAGLLSSETDGQLRSLVNRFLKALAGRALSMADLADSGYAASLYRADSLLRVLQLMEDEQVLVICLLALANTADSRSVRPLMDIGMAGGSDMLMAEAWMALSRLADTDSGRDGLDFGLHHGDMFSRFWAGLAMLMAGLNPLESL
jgi:hypothetical protein